MVHGSSTMWRRKDQPSNSTSCSDNALRLLVLVVFFQDSKMPFHSMNLTPNPIRLTLTKASIVSRLSLVLLLLLTQFCFKKPSSQTSLLVGITSMGQVWDQLIMNYWSLPLNTQASSIPRLTSSRKVNIFTNSALHWLIRSSLQRKCVTNWSIHCSVNVLLSNSFTG